MYTKTWRAKIIDICISLVTWFLTSNFGQAIQITNVPGNYLNIKIRKKYGSWKKGTIPRWYYTRNILLKLFVENFGYI